MTERSIRTVKDRLLVVFDSPVIADSVDVSDLTLSGPTTVAVQSVRPLSDRTIEVTLTGVINNAGSYTLSVGPQILGASGTSMDQDQDGTAGELVDDVFMGTFIVDKSGPRIVAQSPDGTTSSVLTSVTVTFNEPIDPSTLTPGSVELTSPAVRAAKAAFAPLSLVDGFNVRAARAIDSFSNLEGAISVLADESLYSELVTATTPFIDYGPLGNNFTNDFPNLLDTPANDNYLAFEATATLVVPAAGPYTFAMGSNDGYRLEIGDDFSAEFATGRNFATDLATFNFPAAGEYPLKFVFFELTGSQGFELSFAQGVKTEFDDDFFLVGDQAEFNNGIPTLGVEAVDDTDTTFRLFFPPQPIDGDYELTDSAFSARLVRQSARSKCEWCRWRTGRRLHQHDHGRSPTTEYRFAVASRNTSWRTWSRWKSRSMCRSIKAVFRPAMFASLVQPDASIATGIDRINDTTYRINLTRITADGEYEIIVGPGHQRCRRYLDGQRR